MFSIQFPEMPTYRLDIEYDGTDWHGWQIQPDLPTIQHAVEEALATLVRERVKVVGSGRTDAGVHAAGQVAHVVLPQPVDTLRIRRSLNGILPRSIAVRAVESVNDTFHARYDAVSRTYRYRISCLDVAIERAYRWRVRPRPDMARMNTAAEALLGKHDFSSFCRTGSETKNRVCDVRSAAWHPDTREEDFLFEIVADRFLHGMVRSIVGTLIEIGHKKRSANSIDGILRAMNRREAGYAAPARGLTLERVEYPAAGT